MYLFLLVFYCPYAPTSKGWPTHLPTLILPNTELLRQQPITALSLLPSFATLKAIPQMDIQMNTWVHQQKYPLTSRAASMLYS